MTNKKEKFVHKEQINYICGDTPLIVNQNSSNVTDVKKSTIERGPEQIQLECFNKNLYLTKKFILSKFFLLDEHYNSAYVCGGFFINLLSSFYIQLKMLNLYVQLVKLNDFSYKFLIKIKNLKAEMF